MAFLRKEGYERHLGAVWAGIATATAASLIGAWLLYRWAVNEEVFEGVLYLGSAVIVGSMMVWMWRHSHSLSGEMKGSLSQQSCPDPDAFERANYMKALQSYTSEFV